MTNLTKRYLTVGVVAGLLSAATAVWAQQVQPPASGAQSGSQTPASGGHDAPRPDDLEPGVNTSAMPSAGATSPTPAAAPSRAKASHAKASSAKAAGGAQGNTGEDQGSQQDKKVNAARGGKAEDHLQLDPTQITGNQELPKVLYIVPWKRSDLGDLLGKPANSLLDEVLEPVDRDVFKRENRYYDALKPAAPEAPAGAGHNSGEQR